MQDNETENPEEVVIEDISIYEEKSKDFNDADNSHNDTSPQLFSDEGVIDTSSESNEDNNLKSEEEDFEIPAFLRKQKF